MPEEHDAKDRDHTNASESTEQRKTVLGLAQAALKFFGLAFSYKAALYTLCLIALIVAGCFSWGTWISPREVKYIQYRDLNDVVREQAFLKSPFRFCLLLAEKDQIDCAKAVIASQEPRSPQLDAPTIVDAEPPPVPQIDSPPQPSRAPSTKSRAAPAKGQKQQARRCFDSITTNCGTPNGGPGQGRSGSSGTGMGVR